MRGGPNVEQKRFFIDRRNQDQGLHQKLLDRVKCLLGLRRPFEVVGLLQKLIKGRPHSARREMKWLSVVRHPITRCTPFML